MAESVASWGEMDEVEVQSFKDLLKTFGCKLQQHEDYNSMILLLLVVKIQQGSVITSPKVVA